MKTVLHILHLEDNLEDAALVAATLKSKGIECTITCVESRDAFVAALEKGGIDLILSDYSLPSFDGLEALKIVRTRWPDIPLILVSGTLGEELAIDSFKSGVTDYVLKDRLSRLAPAVFRAMQEVKERAEKKKIEAQFVEAQKMEVIGRLAGGIAHDFNNILAVIMGYSDMMKQENILSEKADKYNNCIRQASERAAALVGQLLIFSRKQTVVPVVLDLNRIVEESDSILRRLIDENIELIIHLDRKAGWVNADAGHIGQMLMNLVVNARDAMTKGGKLEIITSSVSLDETIVGIDGPIPSGNYALLAVSDTGTGMIDGVKKHLFEAFFTTKLEGKGTGLGLATCHTIMKQCGGYISVASELGKGTTFSIYFPKAEKPLMSEPAPLSVERAALAGGKETLLLVEDEPSVRHLASSVLEAQGYEVLRATNGKDGLHVAREHKGAPIRLVITDVIMPQMDGKVMAEWLKISHPDLKILFTSGYTDDVIAPHGVLEPGVAFLAKPYTPASLANQVRVLLDVGLSSTGTEARHKSAASA